MRALGTNLTAAQKAMGDAKLRILLAKAGQISKIYYIDSGDDRILNVKHTEQEWSQTAKVVLQDSDATLSALDLYGWIGSIGYGYGDDYSICAPMDILSQRTDSVPGGIATSLRMAGVFDMMGVDEASEAYRPDDTNGDTVKTILQGIAGASFPFPYTHTKAYTIIFDSEDAIIDSFTPKDYFSIAPRESRLSAFKKVLAFTGCRARVERTEGEFYGAIHIFVPTVSGSSYDYEYNNVATDHNFFAKSVRKRVVIPNKVIVSSHPDHEAYYVGEATDSNSFDALGRYINSYQFLRVESDDQCDDIADATIKNLRLGAERGSGFVPMNCGQEVMDYVKITDSRVGDSRVGNIGYINRQYNAYAKDSDRKFSMSFGFGKTARGGLKRPAFEQTELNTIMEYIDERFNELIQWLLDMLEVIPKLHVEKQLIIPVWIPGAPLVDTEAVSDIAATTATGNIKITDLGVPDPTAYGICYNTTGDPYITDTVTDEGAVILTGEYTSALTGLIAETKYYYRPYATNALGTGYGIQRIFTTTA